MPNNYSAPADWWHVEMWAQSCRIIHLHNSPFSPSPWKPPLYSLSLWMWPLWVPHRSGIMQCWSLHGWLIALSIISLKFIHVVVVSGFPSFLSLTTFHWMCLPHFVYPFINVYLVWLLWIIPLWAWVYKYVFKTAFNYFRPIPRNGTAESHSNYIDNFLRNFHNVFDSGCAILHAYRQYKRIPVSSHPCQHLLP